MTSGALAGSVKLAIAGAGGGRQFGEADPSDIEPMFESSGQD
jgi:hypothetical protein